MVYTDPQVEPSDDGETQKKKRKKQRWDIWHSGTVLVQIWLVFLFSCFVSSKQCYMDRVIEGATHIRGNALSRWHTASLAWPDCVCYKVAAKMLGDIHCRTIDINKPSGANSHCLHCGGSRGTRIKDFTVYTVNEWLYMVFSIYIQIWTCRVVIIFNEQLGHSELMILSHSYPNSTSEAPLSKAPLVKDLYKLLAVHGLPDQSIYNLEST